MAVFDDRFQHKLSVESWTLLAIGIMLFAIRMYARGRRNGYKQWALDDYFMIVAMVWYTTLIVCLNLIASGGGSNLIPPDELKGMSKEDMARRIPGSKITVISEQSMLNLIYMLKMCVLTMYGRFMLGSTLNKMVEVLWYCVIVGYFATQIAFLTSCRPFAGYWAIPPPSPQCATLQIYAVVQACFNLSTDLAILYIPMPMVRKLKLPIKQKIILALVFGMGTFVIIAAVLTKVFNLSNVYDTSYMLWYAREASVAVYVANLPLIWPLVREWIPYLRNLSSNKPSYPNGMRPSGRQENGIELQSMGGAKRQSTLRNINNPFTMSTKDDPELGLKSMASSEMALNPGDIRAEVTIEVVGESSEDVDALTWKHATSTGPMTETSISGPERLEK